MFGIFFAADSVHGKVSDFSIGCSHNFFLTYLISLFCAFFYLWPRFMPDEV